MTQSDSILSSLLSFSLGEGRAFVFDIDSTLFCVSPRTEAILKDLADRTDFKNAFPELSEGIAAMNVLPTDWGVRQAVSRLDISVPDAAIRRIRSFWKENFFSNRYLNHDLLYDHANHFVQQCSRHGEVFYLTGRNRSLMEEGTVKQLAQYEFPLKDLSRLIMKDQTDEHDEEFKLNKLKNFREDYSKIYFFENEPSIIESVERGLPTVEIIFMDSTHSSKRPSPTHLTTITPEFYRRFEEGKA